MVVAKHLEAAVAHPSEDWAMIADVRLVRRKFPVLALNNKRSRICWRDWNPILATAYCFVIVSWKN